MFRREEANREYLDKLSKRWQTIEFLKQHNSMENQQLIVQRSEKRQDLMDIVNKNKDEIKKKQIEITPIESNIKSSIELNKGYTIVGKPKEIKYKQGFNHNFYTIKSEFDMIKESQREDLT